jgi:vanillate O-demethylase monooxygenase subunit
VFVALDEPVVDLPDVDAYEDDERVRVDLAPFSGRYGAAQLIDNQLDTTHFAFVHRASFGSPAGRRPPASEIVREPWGFRLTSTMPVAARNDPAVAAGLHPVEQERTMAYRYRAPFFVELRLDYPVMGGSNVIVFFVQPEASERATLYCTLLLAQPGGFDPDELARRVEFEYRVVAEDLTLQERFDDLAMPLEPTKECHVRADRAGLEYRRILADMVRMA